jgi:hypothetical protein
MQDRTITTLAGLGISPTALNFVLENENRNFFVRIFSSSIGYLLITLWLNSIRATTSLWFVWVLIIIQFALYFSIFISGYQRSIVMGLNKNAALMLFFLLAILGRVNDWQIVVIPLLVLVTIIFSARNKKISERRMAMFLQSRGSGAE